MQTFPKEFIYLTNNTWICSLCGITAESPGSERTLSDRGSLVTASTGIPIVPSPIQDSASLRMRLRLLPGYHAVADIPPLLLQLRGDRLGTGLGAVSGSPDRRAEAVKCQADVQMR